MTTKKSSTTKDNKFVVAPSGAGREEQKRISNDPRSLLDPREGMPEGITTNLLDPNGWMPEGITTNLLDSHGCMPKGITTNRPMVSLVVPAYNEAAIIQQTLAELCDYMAGLEHRYRWEIVVVNDGSSDGTGALVEEFARHRKNVRVIHHQTNCNLGQALRTAFQACRGDYIVTLDADLSYSPDHIERLLAKIQETGAQIVLASPYMAGGKCSNVPWSRLVLSRFANRLLSLAAKGRLSTLTGMVRAYDSGFIHSLSLRSVGTDINPEIIHKAQMRSARIEEIPAHLCWPPQVQSSDRPASGLAAQKVGTPLRQSHMKIMKSLKATLLTAFAFRPSLAFLAPAVVILLVVLLLSL